MAKGGKVQVGEWNERGGILGRGGGGEKMRIVRKRGGNMGACLGGMFGGGRSHHGRR